MIIDSHHHLALEPLCPYAASYGDKLDKVAEAYGLDYVCVMGLGDDFPEFGDNQAVLELSEKKLESITGCIY